MADNGGIAALLKALDNAPGLGAGLKPSSKITAKPSRSSEFFAAAGVNKAADIGGSVETGAAAAPAAIRITRPTASASSASARTKTIVSNGAAYDAKAPRGSYVDIVV